MQRRPWRGREDHLEGFPSERDVRGKPGTTKRSSPVKAGGPWWPAPRLIHSRRSARYRCGGSRPRRHLRPPLQQRRRGQLPQPGRVHGQPHSYCEDGVGLGGDAGGLPSRAWRTPNFSNLRAYLWIGNKEGTFGFSLIREWMQPPYCSLEINIRDKRWS